MNRAVQVFLTTVTFLLGFFFGVAGEARRHPAHLDQHKCDATMAISEEFVTMSRELVELHSPAVNQIVSTHLDNASKILDKEGK